MFEKGSSIVGCYFVKDNETASCINVYQGDRNRSILLGFLELIILRLKPSNINIEVETDSTYLARTFNNIQSIKTDAQDITKNKDLISKIRGTRHLFPNMSVTYMDESNLIYQAKKVINTRLKDRSLAKEFNRRQLSERFDYES